MMIKSKHVHVIRKCAVIGQNFLKFKMRTLTSTHAQTTRARLRNEEAGSIADT